MTLTAVNQAVVDDYCQSILSGKKIACKEQIAVVQRYENDLASGKWDFRPLEAEKIIWFIESTFVHKKGEDIDGYPLAGKPLKLLPWQKFIVYNLMGFYQQGKQIRRFHETFILLARKNGKTSFAAALAYAIAYFDHKSGSTCYCIGASQRQSAQAFEFIKNTLEFRGDVRTAKDKSTEKSRIKDNNQEHSIQRSFKDGGSLYFEALAANPDKHDSLSSNLIVADELHAYKTPKQYNVLKESGKAFRNKLMIGITTAGDDMQSFCYRRIEYCKKILAGTVEDDQLFIFMCKADESDTGYVDFTDPVQHEKANPSYGVTVSAEDLMSDAMQALNDPQQRKDFLAKSLNIYTASIRAYFDLDEFRASDGKYDWTLEELTKLPVKWYGGADLSKMHDLTAACLYGRYKDKSGEYIDICVSHAFIPVTQAVRKADEDSIPIFGWKDDGVLTMCNTPTVHFDDVVKWFIDMRKLGFKIKRVGFDKKFGREFFLSMRAAGFKIVYTAQYFWVKSQGFRRIERQVKDGNYYYLHNAAYEYCVSNVQGIEDTDDAIRYEKVTPNSRIDLFDASVFAAYEMLEDISKTQNMQRWLNDGKTDSE